MDFLSAIGHLLNIGQQHPQQAPQTPQNVHPQAQSAPQSGYSPQQIHGMIPLGQPIPQSNMDSFSPQTRALAQIYNQNPQDSRVSHLDPAMFGYAPDNTAPVMGHQPAPLNFGGGSQIVTTPSRLLINRNDRRFY